MSRDIFYIESNPFFSLEALGVLVFTALGTWYMLQSSNATARWREVGLGWKITSQYIPNSLVPYGPYHWVAS